MFSLHCVNNAIEVMCEIDHNSSIEIRINRRGTNSTKFRQLLQFYGQLLLIALLSDTSPVRSNSSEIFSFTILSFILMSVQSNGFLPTTAHHHPL